MSITDTRLGAYRGALFINATEALRELTGKNEPI